MISYFNVLNFTLKLINSYYLIKVSIGHMVYMLCSITAVLLKFGIKLWNFIIKFEAKKVPVGFNYNSGENVHFLTVDELKKLIQEFVIS